MHQAVVFRICFAVDNHYLARACEKGEHAYFFLGATAEFV